MSQLSLAERRELLKSMEVEWQTLLKNYAAKVLSLEETAHARARWLDRAIWPVFGSQTIASRRGRHAKARLIIKGSQTLTSLTWSHIPRRLPVRVL